jgi:hypothetical protein
MCQEPALQAGFANMIQTSRWVYTHALQASLSQRLANGGLSSLTLCGLGNRHVSVVRPCDQGCCAAEVCTCHINTQVACPAIALSLHQCPQVGGACWVGPPALSCCQTRLPQAPTSAYQSAPH